MNTHHVMMAINGKIVESSAVFSGSLEKCEAVASRMNKRPKHPSVAWVTEACA